MGALGYNRNKYTLMELARQLPFWLLASVNASQASDTECLMKQQAPLLGTVGLLPSQRVGWGGRGRDNDEWVDKLEKVWASSRQLETMSEDDWHLFKVRPSNLPARRIAAISYLLLRYREKGILAELINKIGKVPPDTGYNGLEKALRITADRYWGSHLDLGLPSRMSFPALLGGGQAADIVVNVLLPFAVALGRLTAQTKLVMKALDLYRHYPRLAANTVERHMRRQLGISRHLVNSARRQQGLIHIYKTLCSQGKCHDCPIGKAAD